MYDRFVPYLGMLANTNKGVFIDIGANVGDTVAALVRHTDAKIICVEPISQFYALLCKNIKNFGSTYSNRILLVNAYISIDDGINYTSKYKMELRSK